MDSPKRCSSLNLERIVSGSCSGVEGARDEAVRGEIGRGRVSSSACWEQRLLLYYSARGAATHGCCRSVGRGGESRVREQRCGTRERVRADSRLELSGSRSASQSKQEDSIKECESIWNGWCCSTEPKEPLSCGALRAGSEGRVVERGSRRSLESIQ